MDHNTVWNAVNSCVLFGLLMFAMVKTFDHDTAVAVNVIHRKAADENAGRMEKRFEDKFNRLEERLYKKGAL
jgi:hypothetical protein